MSIKVRVVGSLALLIGAKLITIQVSVAGVADVQAAPMAAAEERAKCALSRGPLSRASCGSMDKKDIIRRGMTR